MEGSLNSPLLCNGMRKSFKCLFKKCKGTFFSWVNLFDQQPTKYSSSRVTPLPPSTFLSLAPPSIFLVIHKAPSPYSFQDLAVISNYQDSSLNNKSSAEQTCRYVSHALASQWATLSIFWDEVKVCMSFMLFCSLDYAIVPNGRLNFDVSSPPPFEAYQTDIESSFVKVYNICRWT